MFASFLRSLDKNFPSLKLNFKVFPSLSIILLYMYADLIIISK